MVPDGSNHQIFSIFLVLIKSLVFSIIFVLKFPLLSMFQRFVPYLSHRGLCFRRNQDGPEFIDVAKSLVSLNSNCFNHPNQYSRIIVSFAVDTDQVATHDSQPQNGIAHSIKNIRV
jgi:hypothetical protein